MAKKSSAINIMIDIQKLTIAPGETIVFSIDMSKYREDTVKTLCDSINRFFISKYDFDVPIMFIPNDINITVISPEDALVLKLRGIGV